MLPRSRLLLLELIIPPTKNRPGSSAVERPAFTKEVPPVWPFLPSTPSSLVVHTTGRLRFWLVYTIDWAMRLTQGVSNSFLISCGREILQYCIAMKEPGLDPVIAVLQPDRLTIPSLPLMPNSEPGVTAEWADGPTPRAFHSLVGLGNYRDRYTQIRFSQGVPFSLHTSTRLISPSGRTGPVLLGRILFRIGKRIFRSTHSSGSFINGQRYP